MSSLSKISSLPPASAEKSDCLKRLKKIKKELFELQNVFYADRRFSLLVILQGMDTSGKDGSIRNVMTSMNPMGVRVHSFKKPTEEERRHDFLWRVYPHLPPKGIIQVFNRSYYEDLVVPQIKGELDEDRLNHRINLINGLENHLTQNGVHILKFFLHVSAEEQEKRIHERLTVPHKLWKYDKEDERASKKWDEYAEIYDRLFKSNSDIPWKIIPADKRWYRNYLMAAELRDYLRSLGLKYPKIGRS